MRPANLSGPAATSRLAIPPASPQPKLNLRPVDFRVIAAAFAVGTTTLGRRGPAIPRQTPMRTATGCDSYDTVLPARSSSGITLNWLVVAAATHGDPSAESIDQLPAMRWRCVGRTNRRVAIGAGPPE